ncbi:uncharacterized protein [Fopius arisanus]|uniref:Uncharacterized protein n=1 Tax=Fopius arisanus TaxID=64838 RepID=A0A9R1U3Q4_9HYME|nr:PREDICTED: uncharacterized protein LOC105268474 [Fopius arisanus]
MLTTAIVNTLNKNKGLVRTRLLLDTCSTTNFITERLADKLKLEKTNYAIPVTGINGLTTYTKYQYFSLEKVWKLAEIPKKQFLSPEEQSAEEHYVNNPYRDSAGRYVVALPFKESAQKLSSSKEIAEKRLKSLVRKFHRQPELREQYSAVLSEYLELNHMTKLHKDTGEGFYLPYHAVIKETSLTTKVRVVFGGSANMLGGASVNSALMVGPTIQDDIFTLITRFRLHKYVLTGDIEKMYRQFLVRPQDREYQKILWYDDHNQVTTYQLNTVTFGLSAAAFLAIRSLQQLAQDNAGDYPIAARILQQDMYVADSLTGFSTQ